MAYYSKVKKVKPIEKKENKHYKVWFLLFSYKGVYYGKYTLKQVCKIARIGADTLKLTLDKNVNWNNWELVIREHFVIFAADAYTDEEIAEFEAKIQECKTQIVVANKGGTGLNPNYRSKNDIIEIDLDIGTDS